MESRPTFRLILVLFLGFFAVASVVFFLYGRGQNKSLARLVVLYATCSVNKDYLAVYNKDVRYTPNLFQFANESLVFTKHETESPFSGAAYAALFSGTQESKHGIYYQPASVREQSYLIAEAFRDNGYETFSWNGKSMAAPELNYAQGVQPENVFRASPADGKTLTKNDQGFTRILEHLKSDKAYKAFVQISFSLTHAPYSVNSNVERTESFCREFPKECNGVTVEDLNRYIPLYSKNHVELQFNFDDTAQSLNLSTSDIDTLAKVMDATYKSSVHRLDAAFGTTIQLIRNDGLMDQSLIVFTSDHGEVLFRKNASVRWFHGRLEQDVIDIPLIVRFPNRLHSGQTYSKVTRSVDVFPTIAGFCHLKMPHGIMLDGFDLNADLLNSERAKDLIAYSCSELPSPAVGPPDPETIIVQARQRDMLFRLIQRSGKDAKLKVFDLSKDKFGTTNLYDPKNELQKEMLKQLESYKKRLVANFDGSTDQSKWDEERERLRSLGYIK